ncbi:MAG: hypothetical protein JWN98_1580 [Abditibacteriota bacterium]|nr:hypothetical protein [Abditibacteriota bacterium]
MLRVLLGALAGFAIDAFCPPLPIAFGTYVKSFTAGVAAGFIGQEFGAITGLLSGLSSAFFAYTIFGSMLGAAGAGLGATMAMSLVGFIILQTIGGFCGQIIQQRVNR